MPTSSRNLPCFLKGRPVLIVLLSLLTLSILLWQTDRWTRTLTLNRIQQQGLETLTVYSAGIRSELEKFEQLPRILATYPPIVAAVSNPETGKTQDELSRYLESINALTGTAVTYLIDRHGQVVAASNWRQPLSFIGIQLDYRPYFQQAMRGDFARFFGMGTTSGERGYYFAEPVYQDSQVVGVIVVKVNVTRFETPGRWGDNKLAIADTLGVIFIANDRHWQFRTIEPLDQQTLKTLRDSLRYSDVTLAPLNILDRQSTADGTLMHIREAETDGGSGPVRRYLMQSRYMADVGWAVHVFSDLAPVSRTVLLAEAIILLLTILAIMAVLYWLQHRRALKERLRAQSELESKVEQRTQALSDSNRWLQREIEDRRQAEAELVQASKLVALGQLSAGIVHELNQPIAAIRNYADNALLFLERDRADRTRDNLIRIGELTERIASISSHLKTFARKSPATLAAVDMVRAIDDALALVEPRIRQEQTEIDWQPAGRPVARAELIRLEQVIVNLLLNALEAMHGQHEPRRISLVIETHDTQLSLIVHDSGPGIDSNALGQIFDPFFTTKEIGSGLGLGLSISHKIVRDFGGTLTAANHPQRGAIFTLTLPAS